MHKSPGDAQSYLILSVHVFPVSEILWIYLLSMLILGAYSFSKFKWARKMYGFLDKRWLFGKVYKPILLGQNGLDFGYRIAFKVLDKGTLT